MYFCDKRVNASPTRYVAILLYFVPRLLGMFVLPRPFVGALTFELPERQRRNSLTNSNWAEFKRATVATDERQETFIDDEIGLHV